MISFLSKFKYYCNTPLSSTYSVISKLNMSMIAAEEKTEINSLKRKPTENNSELADDDETSAKKALLVKQERVKRRKVAMLLTYLGRDYQGLQRNPGMKTIEEDVLVALLKAELINDDIFNQPQLMSFQRAARTDKGVSALRQILSLKMPEDSKTEAINEHLPEHIRVMALKRVTKGFNSKSNCDARTYSYTTPTFAFSQQGAESISESYRLTPEVHERVNQVLKMYEGTHNFHNFTSKRLPTDPSVHRYIMSFTCGDPFVVEDLEFVNLRVKGQSFMMHQIRKMVGLAISIVRGLTTTDTVTRSWDRDKLDIPKAPGLGLLLEEVHYDRYNHRYGSDGMHEAMEWSKWDKEVTDFQKKYIFPAVYETEKNEKSMLSWIETLGQHSFDVRTEHLHSELEKAIEKNQGMLSEPVKSDPILAVTQAIET